MACNSFGTHFRITTWGESHGSAIGVTIDGCPSKLPIDLSDVQRELDNRAPGNHPYTSPRKEKDKVEILSGVFEGYSTGAPITLLIRNHDADSSKYEPIKHLLRPGHANFTYLAKYGIFDYRGGGRSSARETACRVAAGAIAKVYLRKKGISVGAHLCEIGGMKDQDRWPAALEEAIRDKDSLGGIVEARADGLPVGLGEPVYGKLEACLASAMLSIPAAKGFEIGDGFALARMRGSEANDPFCVLEGRVQTKTNRSGGVLGGISSGMPLAIRVPFKPTSSIGKPQDSVDLDGNRVEFRLPEGSRHDPCVAIRAVPVVEAMLALVIADLMLAGNF